MDSFFPDNLWLYILSAVGKKRLKETKPDLLQAKKKWKKSKMHLPREKRKMKEIKLHLLSHQKVFLKNVKQDLSSVNLDILLQVLIFWDSEIVGKKSLNVLKYFSLE